MMLILLQHHSIFVNLINKQHWLYHVVSRLSRFIDDDKGKGAGIQGAHTTSDAGGTDHIDILQYRLMRMPWVGSRNRPGPTCYEK